MQHFVNQLPAFQPAGFAGAIPPEELLAEPCLLASSPFYVTEKAGPLAREALSRILELYDVPIRRATAEGLSAVVDLRVHRLFTGMYPGIPGWHCDAVPRGAYSGQPNFSLVHPLAFHVALLLSDHQMGVSNTEFVNFRIHPQIHNHERVYADLHDEVERMNPPKVTAKDNEFVWFNQKTIHRAMPAHRRGTRLFMRFSMVEKPMLANQKTTQQQIYLLSERNGW